MGKIAFKGNHVFSDRKLIRAMKHDRPYAIPLYFTNINVMSKTYDHDKLIEDIEVGIRGLYRDNGEGVAATPLPYPLEGCGEGYIRAGHRRVGRSGQDIRRRGWGDEHLPPRPNTGISAKLPYLSGPERELDIPLRSTVASQKASAFRSVQSARGQPYRLTEKEFRRTPAYSG